MKIGFAKIRPVSLVFVGAAVENRELLPQGLLSFVAGALQCYKTARKIDSFYFFSTLLSTVNVKALH